MNDLKGLRIINYGIDQLVIIIMTSILIVITQGQLESQFLILVYILYYCVFETFKGQTLGKMITKTHVIDNNNNKPNFIRIFARTILRLNPLDVFSFVFGNSQGTHDVLSGTKLVKK